MKVHVIGDLPASWEDFIIKDPDYPIRLITIYTEPSWDEFGDGPYPLGATRVDGDCADIYTSLNELSMENVRPYLCEILGINDNDLELSKTSNSI